MKYIDAKVTAINGGLHISWKTEDGNWQPATPYDVENYVAQDPILLKKWIHDYKNNYNSGIDIEAAQITIPNIPTSVTSLLNQPLNLSV